MKKLFFFLICAFVAISSAFAQGSTSVSPDLARHEINAGKVKKMVVYDQDGGVCKEVNFTKNGEEKKGSECKKQSVKRDTLGRLVYREKNRKQDKVFETSQYNRDTFAYVGNELRPQMEDAETFENQSSFVLYRRSLTHYIYGKPDNAPTKDFTYSEVEGLYLFCYAEYKYLEFDEQGNWTKREATIYQTDVLPEEGNMEKYYPLFEATISNAQRDELEIQLAQYLKLMEGADYTYTETRQIKYYK